MAEKFYEEPWEIQLSSLQRSFYSFYDLYEDVD